MLSNHLILCHPLLLLPSIFLSIRGFSSELALHIRWPKDWNFSISPSNEYSGLISFRIDWFDILAVQGTLWSLLQHHHLKASVLQCSTFFTAQLSHPHMTTGKTIVLTIQTLFLRTKNGGLVAKLCPTLATPWTVAHQALSTGFSRQEYWSGLPFPSPGDLPDPVIEPGSSALQAVY